MSTTADDLFDPSEMETVEPLPPETTDESAYIPDTLADPEGSEARAEEPAVSLPPWFYKNYALDDDGKPTFNALAVRSIMGVFDAKAESTMGFSGDDPDAEEKYYDSQVNAIVAGVRELLVVDPQTTGINFLQLTTRTWAEFVSIAYEYQDSISRVDPSKGLPDWIYEREEKMMQFGRKARLLRDAVAIIDADFGLRSTSLDRGRVQSEVERRLQRLAEWNFNKHADTSVQVANTLNSASVTHAENVFANA